MTADHPEVSLVVPCHNEADNLSALYERVLAVMDQTGKSWEMICVNDGSKDDTLNRLLTLHRKYPRVLVIDLSRNFGKEAALTAGLDHTQGDCAIPLTNGFLEGFNSLLQSTMAKARGYRTDKNFINMAYLILGNLGNLSNLDLRLPIKRRRTEMTLTGTCTQHVECFPP